jgi:YggT family protein
MHPIPRLIVTLISIYFLIIIVMVIAFWLNQFGVIDVSEPITARVYNGLLMLTDPVLNPIRALLPDLGGLDISPALALVGLWFIQYGIVFYASPGRRKAAPEGEAG